MMNYGKFYVVLLVGLCFCSVTFANDPNLVLWLAGPNDWTDTQNPILVEVYAKNTDFGLGSLSYELTFTELLELSREYSDYGWVANDGMYDISNPVDGAAPGPFTTIRFDTVVDPAGSEFPSGTSGIVELLTIYPLADMTTQRCIYIDLLNPSASDGMGYDLETTLGGSINLQLCQNPYCPELSHAYAVLIPEPATVLLFGLGGLALLRRRKA